MNEEESKETYYANNRIKALRTRAGLKGKQLYFSGIQDKRY